MTLFLRLFCYLELLLMVFILATLTIELAPLALSLMILSNVEIEPTFAAYYSAPAVSYYYLSFSSMSY